MTNPLKRSASDFHFTRRMIAEHIPGDSVPDLMARHGMDETDANGVLRIKEERLAEKRFARGTAEMLKQMKSQEGKS